MFAHCNGSLQFALPPLGARYSIHALVLNVSETGAVGEEVRQRLCSTTHLHDKPKPGLLQLIIYAVTASPPNRHALPCCALQACTAQYRSDTGLRWGERTLNRYAAAAQIVLAAPRTTTSGVRQAAISAEMASCGGLTDRYYRRCVPRVALCGGSAATSPCIVLQLWAGVRHWNSGRLSFLRAAARRASVCMTDSKAS